MTTLFAKKNLFLSLFVLMILVLPQIGYAGVGDAVGGAIQTLLYNFVVVVFGMLVRFGGMLLDAGIEYFVIGFGDVFNNSGVGLAVNNTWVIIRDFVNLFFIFGLVYIGIRMILDSDNSNTRRWLVNLIMAALLVNFSLFATKFVVDFSNKLATEIADAGLGADKDKAGVYTANVSGELMLRMGITTSLGGDTTAMPENAGWGYIFGIAILFMVAAFVFAAGGILLIIRFAVICMYLVLSPVMFASWVLPGLSDTMNRYWKDFIKRCFVAPIYFTFIYFSFQIMGGLQQTIKASGSGANATSLASPNWSATLGAAAPTTVQDSTLGTLPFFVLICIFMIGSLVAANKLGAEGADKAMSIGKKLNNKVQSGVKRGAGAVTAGAGASLGRNTLGRRGNNWANDGDLKLRAQQGGLAGMRARTKLAVGGYAAGASFDARQVGGVGKSLGVGEGKAGGYKKRLEDDAKAAKKKAENLGTVDIDSGEGKERADAEAARIRTEASAKKDTAQGTLDSFNESRNNSANFSDETTKRKKALAALEDDLRVGNTDKTLTTREREELEGKINNQKLDINKREQGANARTRVQQERNKYIASQNAMRGYRGSDAAEKTRLKDEEEKAKAAWEKQEKDETDALMNEISSAEEDHATAKGKADASIKYERQIAFMERKRREAATWSSVGTKSASGAGAGVLGALVGATIGGLGYGATGYAAARAKGDSNANIVKELEKEYGKDGDKKMKKDRRLKEKRETKEANKDLDDDTDDGAANKGNK